MIGADDAYLAFQKAYPNLKVESMHQYKGLRIIHGVPQLAETTMGLQLFSVDDNKNVRPYAPDDLYEFMRAIS